VALALLALHWLPVEHNRIVVTIPCRVCTEGQPRIRIIPTDLIQGELDFAHLSQAMQGVDIIVHCAAIAGIDTVIKNPVKTMQVNMVGSANVLEAASCLSRCDRVVCFSTSEVFCRQAFHSTEMDNTVLGKVGEARWTYAVSKLAEEHLAIAYYQEKWLPTTVCASTLRP
jgi:UDP-glucose 4-epimerase